MYYNELNPQQKRDISIFHLILETYGWKDYEDTEGRMEAGENLLPEAERVYTRKGLSLTVQFHLPIRMISLLISSEEGANGSFLLHFFYDEQPERILEWLVEVQDQVERESFEVLLEPVFDDSAMVLLHQPDDQLFELKAPKQTGDLPRRELIGSTL